MATPRQFNEQQTFDLIDRVWKLKGRVPGCDECRKAGYRGGTAHFNAARSDWARERKIQLRPSQREEPYYLPRDIDKEAEAVRLSCGVLPKLEIERGTKGRPLSTPYDQLSPSQQAVQLYRASWKRIREVGA